MGPFVLALGIALLSQEPKPAPARVEGRVVDGLCANVGDAEVVAFANGREVARARSDGSGAFVLADLPHAIVIVRARGKGLAFAVARVDLTGDDFAAPRLQCFASRTLTGKVLGDGKPVAGAQVIAQPDGLPEFVDAPPLAVTGADGSYRLEGVVIGPAQVRVWAPGLPLAEQKSEGPGDATVDFTLDAHDVRELVVRVRGATPAQLAATQVRLAADARGERLAMPPGLATGTPDAEGIARFPGWPAGDLAAGVVVSVPDAVTDPWRHVGYRGHEFTVAPVASRQLRGVVHTMDGKALPHRRLLLRPLDDAAWSFAVVTGETGDDGAFTLVCPVSSGEQFALRLVDDQWVLQGNEGVWYVAAFDQARALQVGAVQALSIHTMLRGPDGTPIGGADVSVLSGRRVIGSGTSRSDGSVDIEGLKWLEFFSIRVASPQWVVPPLRLEKGADPGGEITRTMVPAGAITGRVVDNGALQPGARVRFGARMTVTDAEGRFRFDGVLPGWAELESQRTRRGYEVGIGEAVVVELRY
jgi:hypothetical protein